MKNLVIANWKMNFDVKESVEHALEIAERTKSQRANTKILICPTTLAIPEVAKALEDSGVLVGAQSSSWENSGALTGEISPDTLKQYCQYVIVGHSERRMYLHETNSMVARKISAVLNAGMKPIVCIGETLEEYDRGESSRVLEEVKEAFSMIDSHKAEDVIIAYEPLWAISTSKEHSDEKMTCQYAGGISTKIKDTITALYDKDTADKIKIIYGGSVTPENIEELHCQPDISGYLVGSASLDSDEFAEIVKNVS
jgi:triosephosphate isomerase